jgi:hypothetical protein
MDRTKRLLSHGYFPSQLPPCFKTLDLANNYAVLYEEWIALQPPPKKEAKVPKAPSSKAELFSVARAGHQRRVTSLPNPVAQTYLAFHVAQNWRQLVKHYRQSRLSASHPRFLKAGSRAANIPSMQLLYERKILKSAGYRYMLKTDISRFFPTIYTHSVPWALHGKAVAKRNRKVTSKYFGNLLDLSLRQGQDEQTMGLPIGPDTSHIIAEAIATSVDLELKKRMKSFPAGFRYVDDYFMFFATAHEAEEALAALMRSLKEFELHINFEKTKTSSVIEITDDYWPHQLRSFQIAKDGRKQASDINHFFELAKVIARQNSDESVMMYALKRASSILVRKENWDCFEAHVCHVALAYPNTLQTVARILSTYNHVGYMINRIRLARMINAVIQDHAPLGHHSEVSWGLWMCKDLGIKLSDANIDLVSEMHSSVCALILLDLYTSGKLSKTPKFTYWKHVEISAELHGDLWLLSYEAGMRGWAGFSDAHIIADQHFALVKAKDIHFYDTSASLSPIFHAKPDALRRRSLFDLADLFDLHEVDELIEYEEGDGGYEGVIFDDETDEIGDVVDTDADEEDDDDLTDPFSF